MQPAASKPAIMVRRVHQASDLASSTAWRFLGTPSEELRLEYTLPTGQSFRWRDMGEGLFTGVIGKRVVSSPILAGFLSCSHWIHWRKLAPTGIVDTSAAMSG